MFRHSGNDDEFLHFLNRTVEINRTIRSCLKERKELTFTDVCTDPYYRKALICCLFPDETEP